MSSRIDASGVVGVILFMLIVAIGTLALVLYKGLEPASALTYGSIALIIIFILSLFFGGVKLPRPE